MTSVNVTTTKNTVTVSEGDTRIVTIKTQGPQGPSLPDGDKGDVTVSSNGTAISINSNSITSAKIADGAIVDADINASAAIAGTKISPDFGSQNIATTGSISAFNSNITGSISISNNSPTIFLTDSNDTPDYGIRNDNGAYKIIDLTNSADRFVVNTDGHIDLLGNVDISSGLDVTGSIISSSDGNQVTQGNAALTLTHATNSNLRANHLIVDDFPSGGGTYFIQATESGVSNDRNMCLQGYGGKLKIGGNSVAPTELLDVAGNIAVSGTVDGRDLGADGTKLDGIETGATADQTASEIVALVADQTIAPSIIDMEDNEEIRIGTSDDLIIVHDGHSRIKDTGSGALLLETDGGSIQLNKGTSENMIVATVDGKVELFHNGIGKIETQASGIGVSGNISVSGTVDGRYVAADGTKLDGIEINATADQTASEILTLIKTVDGAGSGLDADTLDGISSASFLRSDTNATFSGSTLTVNATLLLLDSIRIGDDAFIEDYNAANSVRIKGNQDTNKGFIAFGQQTKKLGVDGVSAALTYDGNTVIDSAYTGALANGITATTQSASDNSTKVATTAYTDTAIANLVNSAPSTLDTLGEIATALNNDAALNTTLTNSIATKMPLAGGQFTGNITFSGTQTVDGRDLSVDGSKLDGIESGATADQSANEILTLIKTVDGDGSGLDADTLDGVSSASFCRSDAADTCSGKITFSDGIVLPTTGDGIKFGPGNATNDDAHIEWLGGGNAGYLRISISDDSGSASPEYIEFGDYENIDKGGTFTRWYKLSRSGHEFTGNVQIPNDSGKLQLGASQDLSIFHDGSNSFLTNATGEVNIRNSGTIKLQVTSGGENAIVCQANNNVELYYDNSKKFETTSTGASVTGSLGINTTTPISDVHISKSFHSPAGGIDSAVALTLSDTTAGQGVGMCLLASPQSVSFIDFGDHGDANIGSIKYNHPSEFMSFTVNAQERMTIDSSGNLNINKDNAKLQIGQHQDIELFHNGTNSFLTNNTNQFTIRNATADADFFIKADDVRIWNSAGNEQYIAADRNNTVRLYFDNSKKLETMSDGVSITGHADITGELNLIGSGAKYLDVDTLTNSNTFFIRHRSNTGSNFESAAKFIGNGAVELYYDHSKKLETKSNGVEITGNVDISGLLSIDDNQKAVFGDSHDLEIKFDGTHSKIDHTPATGSLFLGGDGLVLANSGFSEYYLIATENGAVQLNYDAVTKLETTSEGISVVGQVDLTRQNTSNEGGEVAFRRASDNTKQWYIDVFGSDNNANLRFHSETGPNGSGRTYAELSFTQFVLNFGLDLNINHVAGKLKFQDYLNIHHDGTHSRFHNNTGALLLETDNNSIQLNKGTSENMVKANIDGSVEVYYDNSKKLETKSTGIEIHNGGLDLNRSTSLHSGAIYFDSPTDTNHVLWNDYFGNPNTTRTTTDNFDGMKWNCYGGLQLFRGNEAETIAKFLGNGANELYYDNVKKLETTSAGATVTGNFQNNGQIIANLQANISTQGNPALIITSSTNTNMRANFLMEDDYTSGRGALMIQVTESGVSNDRDLILMGFGGKTGVGGTPTSDFHVHGNSAFNGTIGVGVTSPVSNNKLHLRLADSSIATPSTASVLLAENNTNAWITIGSGASSYGGILFGDSGQSDRGQVRFNHNGDIMQLIANEEKLFQATLNGTAELYFDNGVKLKTNTAGVIVQNDVYLNNANSNVFFNSDGSSFYGSSPAIGRAGSDNFHITGSGAGDLVIAAEYGERIIFGLTTNTSGAPTIKMTMNPGGQIDGDFNDTSDANLKENITPIPDNAIADIKKLKPVTFDWKETNGNNNVSGFIAQDVKEVIPNLINGKEWSEEDQSSRYTINTIGVVAHLTKALQEAIAKIELLETKVAALEAE